MSDPSVTPAPARKRGAQPGNANAQKHGFYSRTWKHRDHNGLAEMRTTNLVDEINLLRVFTRRLVENHQINDSPSSYLQFVRTLSVALIALNRLIKTHNAIRSSDPEYRESCLRAHQEAAHKMRSDVRPNDLI